MTVAVRTSTLSRAVHDPTAPPHGARQRWSALRVSSGGLQPLRGFRCRRPSRSFSQATRLLQRP